jgi:hypothetical protein
MRKYRKISHNLRKKNKSTGKKVVIGILEEPKGKIDRSKPGKRQFYRKQKNTIKLRTRLRGLADSR